jgi:hypothetical protein
LKVGLRKSTSAPASDELRSFAPLRMTVGYL